MGLAVWITSIAFCSWKMILMKQMHLSILSVRTLGHTTPVTKNLYHVNGGKVLSVFFSLNNLAFEYYIALRQIKVRFRH